MSNLKYIFNPFTTKLEIVKGNSAESIVRTYGCELSTAVGDFVHFNPIINESVITEVGNTNILPVVGVVIDKLSTTTCSVMFQGVLTGFTGLDIGRKVFLSNAGSITDVVATSGYLQTLGIASSDDTVVFNPNQVRVKRV